MSAPPDDAGTASGDGDRPAAARAAEEIGGAGETSRLRSRVTQLETELERKEAQLESVRRQYEAILQENDYDVGERGSGQSGLLDLLR